MLTFFFGHQLSTSRSLSCTAGDFQVGRYQKTGPIIDCNVAAKGAEPHKVYNPSISGTDGYILVSHACDEYEQGIQPQLQLQFQLHSQSQAVVILLTY